MKQIQRRLMKKEINLTKPYSTGSYNKFNNKEQWIRITEGCVHNCPFCYEPTNLKEFDIPKIVRNKVKILDMNLLCHKNALQIINQLGLKRVNNKVIHYELICGIDYRFLDYKIALALKNSRFKNIRIAWDWSYLDQIDITNTIKLFKKVGYKPELISVFMICNWKIPYNECLRKLDLCKVWNVKVNDCYFDNQTSPNIIPVYWSDQEIKDFRRKCRKHNQLVRFKIDPEVI